MVRLGDDITHAFLPSNRTECNYEQLRFLKGYEIDGDKRRSIHDWLTISATSEVTDELVATYDSELLAEAIDDCFQICLGSSEVRFTPPFAYKSISENLAVLTPEMACTTICFGQYVQADEQLMLFVLTNDMKHLWKLCGILCRPSDEQAYSNNSDSWTNKVKRVFDKIDAYLILDFFLNSRELMQKRFPDLFPKQKSDAEEKTITFQDVKRQREAYDTKIVQYADKPSQKDEQWRTNAWTVLEFINYDINKAKQLHEQQKKWEKSQHTKRISKT